MMAFGLFDKEQKEARKVSKAFLITGGTEQTRQCKCEELYQGDAFLMHGNYNGENESAIIFSLHHADFEGMTFEEAKALAGSTELGADFRTSTFGREPRFGVINVIDVVEQPSCNL